jgi:hypothetical protein
MRAIIPVLFLSVALAVPVSAQDAAKEGSASAGTPKKERLICKREAELGTHMVKRVCKTWAEWRAEDNNKSAESQRLMDRIQDRASAAGAAGAMSAGGGGT